jgi:hypothetical protein
LVINFTIRLLVPIHKEKDSAISTPQKDNITQ